MRTTSAAQILIWPARILNAGPSPVLTNWIDQIQGGLTTDLLGHWQILPRSGVLLNLESGYATEQAPTSTGNAR